MSHPISSSNKVADASDSGRTRPRVVGGLVLALTIVASIVGVWVVRETVFAESRPRGDSGATNGLSVSIASEGRVEVGVIRAGEVSTPLLFESYRGEVRARRSSSLSMRRSGRLVEVLVHEGDRVSQGDVLARLDVSDLDVREMMADADVAAASAALDEAVAGPREQTKRAASARVRQLESQLASAERRLERQMQLSQRSAGTDQELDDARYATDELRATLAARTAELDELEDGTRDEQVAAARARLASATAASRQIDVERDDSQIVAPYSGVIAIRQFDEGEMIGPSQGVLTILESEPLEARFGVPPSVCRQWKLGDQFWVSVNETTSPPETARPGQSRSSYLGAKIVRMQPQVDEVTRTRGVDFELVPRTSSMDSLAGIHIGQTARLWVPWGENGNSETMRQALSDPFWVTTESLVRGVRGLWSVYVAVPDEKERAQQANATEIASEDARGVDGMTNNTVKDVVLATIERREVQVLRSAGPLTLVHGMLSPGEWIVSEGVGQIGPGVAVRVRWKDVDLSLTEITPAEVSRR